ncbi:MAG: PVC-type heme-binding CxxCH protein, partial [Limisphaerales bacterium]
FDENNRMFVVEMIDYSEMRDARPHTGRIRMLEDTDGDGVFDKSTVFADDLPWPTAVFCANGGVYAAATPDIFFLKDTNGDGKADVRQVAFTGFASSYAPYRTNELNMQALLNSFHWGPDNRIHGATAPNGGEVHSPLTPGAKPLNLRGQDFAFDPRTLELSAEAGGGQYGMCIDDRGRRFACNNSDHIRVFMYDARYAARNRHFPMPPALVSIAADGPAAEVYRRSPDEPWRVIRTRWRVTGAVKGLVEGGGRPSGYFTSATGLAIYRGDAWPKEYVGDAFIADCGSNLIHRKKVRQNGVELIAERPPDEQKTEFLTSNDTWFRPVQMVNAPDGCLYVIDMYREIIEHPWSLPPALKKHLDLNSGNDRGRIYRIVPDGFKQPRLPRLGGATTAGLVAALAHPNGWRRETAHRLLYERQDKSAIPLLETLLQTSKAAPGRMHALCVLDGLSALTPGHLLTALEDPAGEVREQAVRLAEKVLANKSSSDGPLFQKLTRLTTDPDPLVRYQLAFTLGEFAVAMKAGPLAEIALRDGESRWVQAAILSSLAEGAGDLFATLSSDPRIGNARAGQEFLRQLVQLIGVAHKPAEITTVFNYVARVDDPSLAFSLVRSLGDGLLRGRSSLAKVDTQGNLKTVFSRASQVAVDPKAAEPVRAQGIQLLGLTSYANSGAALLSLLDARQPETVQLAAIDALDRFTDAQLGGEVIKRWNNLNPRTRSAALTVLLKRTERAADLLKAILAGHVRAGEVSLPQMTHLQSSRDQKVRELAAKVFGNAAVPKRQDVVNAYLPALSLKGNAAKGKEMFTVRCVSCHRAGGQGFDLGPNLVTVKTAGKEKMLVSILDPNRELLPQYLAYEMETRDAESLLGIIVNETAGNVTVRQAFGKESVVPRAAITKLKSQGQSLMPEGLEVEMTVQDLADLLDYISTVETQ